MPWQAMAAENERAELMAIISECIESGVFSKEAAPLPIGLEGLVGFFSFGLNVSGSAKGAAEVKRGLFWLPPSKPDRQSL